MKQKNLVLRTIWIYILCTILHVPAKAQKYDPLAYMDSVEFSLLTCSPHEEIYSLYGHTALRYKDLHEGHAEDMVFNWGVFNYHAPHFVSRFVFGLTDYELGLSPYEPFCRYYKRWGSSVVEQVLNLTVEEKLALNLALEENYQEQNRIYRYNFFYDNCSTRPRDIIEHCIRGKVVYEPRQDFEPSFREMIHEKVAHHDWAMFGNDMLLGLKADCKTTRQEQEFLPENLLYDFDHAKILGEDGSWRPLIKERRMAVPPGVQVKAPDFIFSPMEGAVILLIVSLLILAAEWKRKKTYKYWDALLMMVTGLAGCVLTVMIFSEHPATSLNLQLLLVNPIHLFFLPAVLKRRKTRYWTVLLIMSVLFLAGRFLQDYATGMEILACCLIIRFCSHLKNEK